MELQQCIENRRSVRKFKEKSVDMDVIAQIVDSASLAPSWKNSQATRYYILTNKEKKAEIAQTMPDYNKSATNTCPVLVVSTVVRKRSGYNRQGEFDSTKGKGWQMYDCGLSNMIFTLKAYEFGLDTVIMGLYDEETIARVCEIPETEEVISVIPLGYADETPNMPPRKKAYVIMKEVM